MDNMDNHSFNNNRHLTHEELIAYHYGRLSNQEMHRLESHLIDCELCNTALEGMTHIDESNLEKHLQTTKIRVGIKEKSSITTKYWLAAAASFILIAIVSLILIQYTPQDNQLAEKIEVAKGENEYMDESMDESAQDNLIDEDIDETGSSTSGPTDAQVAKNDEQDLTATDTTNQDEIVMDPVEERLTDQETIAENTLTQNENLALDVPEMETDTIEDVLVAEAFDEEVQPVTKEEDDISMTRKAAAPSEAQPRALEEIISEPGIRYINPAPERGQRAFDRYIRRNIKYPDTANENNIKGEVVVEFTVNLDGTTANHSIKQSLGYGCDEEAIRLIREGPKWSPATRDGVPVTGKVSVNIAFDL